MTDRTPLVSILIPTFNRPGYFKAALDSALDQTYGNIEIIVSDDSSDDETEQLMSDYLRKHANIRYLRNRPGWGAAINFQKCLELARGEYVNYLMDDDLFHPDKIERMISLFRAHPALALVTSTRAIIDENGLVGAPMLGLDALMDRDAIIRGRDAANLCLSQVTNYLGEPTTVLFKRAWLTEPFGVFLGRHYGCNVDMASWCVLLRHGDLGFIRDTLSYLRTHPGQQSNEVRMHLRGLADWAHQVARATTVDLLTDDAHLSNAVQRLMGSVNGALPRVAEARVGALVIELGLFNYLNELSQIFCARFSEAPPVPTQAVERQFAPSTVRAGLEVGDTSGAVLSRPPQSAAPWLLDARAIPGNAAWAGEAMQRWRKAGTLPRMTLTVFQHHARSMAPTVDSLAAQWYGAELVEFPATDADLLTHVNHALLPASADWVGLIDAGDTLAPDATFCIANAVLAHPDWQLVYTDEDTLTADGQYVNPHCKPDFNLDYLRSLPYIGGLLLIRHDLFEALGGFDPAFEGAEDYDLVLRAWEHLQATGAGDKAIGHVAEVLYHRAQGSGHTKKSVPEILAAGQAALQAHFKRLGIAAEVQPGPFPPAFRVRWPLPEIKPLVSILVPTRNQIGFLQRCVESVIEKTKYPAYELIVIDNDSDDADTCRYLDAIEAREAELAGRLRVLRQPGPFNFSAMNNAAARAARGDYLLLLNNDTAALHDDWLDEMMGHAVRPDVGIVGAKLLYPDGKIQHAGVILGMRGPAEHPFIGRAPEDRGYFGRAQLVQDLSAVTGACLLVRKSVYEQVGGLDETDFKVSYNDIDLCLKVREAGLRIVFTPFSLLLHEGSASQKGKVEAAPDEAKLKRYAAEKDAMYRKWLPQLAFDPAYNRHLSLASTEFLLDDQPCLSWDPEWRPRPRILVHPADREGCGEYRIISPMRALNRAGMTQGWETMRLFEPAEMQRMDPDVLVVQRQMEWPQIEAIERHGRYHGAFRVFEIDDLITNLPVKSVHKAQIHKDIAKRFRKAAGLCNRLVVATEPLAQAYAGFADEVVVCPNHVEGARWGHLQPPRAERAKPRVGWAGGIGHTGDLELIADVVRDTAAEVDWVFFGMCPDSLKGVVKEFHPGVPLDQYAAKLASLDLDLAVAPLEDNPFNDAKSHLRLLEYGILGYPVICSDLTPYQGDFPVTRVANRYRDWMRAIREALAEPDALRAQADALRHKVRANWLLEDHLDRWLQAWLP
ncbi:chondroitin synthase [mine drainage metagenome]|uniref:Chondroitin synthase n=1 Tax=mine drainage metagenome TaxID=410659 RepID=A0A1J5REB7_9ZZZZ